MKTALEVAEADFRTESRSQSGEGEITRAARKRGRRSSRRRRASGRGNPLSSMAGIVFAAFKPSSAATFPHGFSAQLAASRQLQPAGMRKKRTFLHRVANWSDPTHRGRLGKGVGLPSDDPLAEFGNLLRSWRPTSSDTADLPGANKAGANGCDGSRIVGPPRCLVPAFAGAG